MFQLGDNAKRKLPPKPDYPNFVLPKSQAARNTSTAPCCCSVCIIARKKVGDKFPFKGKGNPLGKPKQKPESPAAETLAVCSKCWGVLQAGREINISAARLKWKVMWSH